LYHLVASYTIGLNSFGISSILAKHYIEYNSSDSYDCFYENVNIARSNFQYHLYCSQYRIITQYANFTIYNCSEFTLNDVHIKTIINKRMDDIYHETRDIGIESIVIIPDDNINDSAITISNKQSRFSNFFGNKQFNLDGHTVSYYEDNNFYCHFNNDCRDGNIYLKTDGDKIFLGENMRLSFNPSFFKVKIFIKYKTYLRYGVGFHIHKLNTLEYYMDYHNKLSQQITEKIEEYKNIFEREKNNKNSYFSWIDDFILSHILKKYLESFVSNNIILD